MRIKKLIINNIASIENAEINFDGAPLKQESLFLICGATGAGKTTILDAICLALFNTTPRMRVGGNDSFMPTGATETVTLKDPVQLLRHGASDGSVVLTFVGNDSVDYEATWSVRMKRTFNLDSAKWSLKKLSTNRVFEKKSEVAEEMQRILGVGFSDFMKTTMLAQGDFAQFLKSDAKEKANILQSLLGDDIYERIGKKIYEVHDKKKKEKETQQKVIENYKLLSQDELSDKKAALLSSQQQVVEKSVQKKDAQAKADWLKQYAENQASLKEKEEQLKRFSDQMQTENYRTEENVVKLWVATAQARSWMASLHDKKEQLVAENDKGAEFNNRFSTMCSGVEGLKSSIEENVKTLDALSQSIDNCTEEQRSMYDQADTIVEKLNTAQKSKSKVAEIGKELVQKEAMLPKLQEALDAAEKALSKEQASDVDCQNRVDAVANQIREIDANGDLLEKSSLWADLLSNLKGLKGKLSMWLSAQKEEKDCAELLESEKQKSLTLQAAKESAESAFKNADLVYQSAAKAVNDMAKELRRGLHEGDACPVCGQMVHTILSDEHFQSVLAEPEKKRGECETALRKAISDLEASSQLIKKYQKDFANKESVTKKAKAGYDESESEVVDAYEKLSVNCDKAKLTSELLLDVEIEKAASESDALKQKTVQLNELQKQKDECQQAKNRQSNSVVKAKDLCDKARKEREALQGEIRNLRDLCASETKDEQLVLDELDAMVAILDWKEKYSSDCQALISKVVGLSKTYKKWIEDKKQLEDLVKEERKTYEQVEEMVKSILDLTKWAMPVVSPMKVDKLLQASANLQSDLSAWKAKTIALEKDVDSLEANLKGFLAEHSDVNEQDLHSLMEKYNDASVNELQESHKKIVNDHASCKGECAVLQNQQAELNKKSPQFVEGEKERESLYFNEIVKQLDASLEELNRQIGSLERELRQNDEDQKKVAAYKEELEKISAEVERWYKLNSLLGDSQGDRFKKLALRLVFDHLLQNANRYLRHFDDNFELAKQANFVIEVKDYRSNKSLSSSGLSGGQQFMVSLALALGLADMADNSRCSPDTIFIDEGFGTLSEEYLTKVMDCLEKLHQTTGKRVGIISHVELLRDRIATQIIVEGGNTSSPSKVKVVGVS